MKKSVSGKKKVGEKKERSYVSSPLVSFASFRVPFRFRSRRTSHDRPDNTLGRTRRQAHLRGDHDRQRRRELGAEAARRRELGERDAHRADDVVAVGREAQHEADRRDRDDPDGRLDLGGQRAPLVDLPDGGERAGHVSVFGFGDDG